MTYWKVARMVALVGFLSLCKKRAARADENLLTQEKYRRKPRKKRMLTSSSPARSAVYNPLLRAPLCFETGSSCDTGDALIAGVGSYEQNSPNTFDGCGDRSAAVYRRDESIDRIVVKSKDGGTMTAGTVLEIQATVSTAADVSTRSNPDLVEIAHMWYHSESHGGWNYVCSKTSYPGVGNVTFSCDFQIPDNNYYTNCGSSCGFQIVRVNYGYGEYAVEACTETPLWDDQYSDADDLVFLVAPAPAAPSSMPSLASSNAPSESLIPSSSGRPSAAEVPPSASMLPSSRPSGQASFSRDPSHAPSSPDRMAVYDPHKRAPVCFETGPSCDTGDELIADVGAYEQNSPNTIDGCVDNSAAVHQRDESIDRIVVKSKDGGTMTAGATLQVQATVSTAVDVSTRSNPDLVETVHMYYHTESSGWKYICTKTSSPGVGSVTFSCDFQIPPENNYYANCEPSCGLQTVRVNYGYGEYAVEACTETPLLSDVQYSDADDLVFRVAPAPAAPSEMPSPVPSTAPSKTMTPSGRPSISKAPSREPSGAPSVSRDPSGAPSENYLGTPQEPGTDLSSPARQAVYDPLKRAPVCSELSSSCDTGDALIAGVGGYEQNSPNTIDSCTDQSSAVYQRDESIDRIVVKSKDGGTMTAGTALEIRATVSTAVDVSTRSDPDLYEIAHMWYHAKSIGTWEYICTETAAPGGGNVTFACDFEIPEDNYFTFCGSNCGLQMVRVNYGYGEYGIEACTREGIWDVQYSDADDLVFLVAPAPLPQAPSVAPSLSMSPSTNDLTPSPEVSDFYFVCASNFVDALTHCTGNRSCPTGTECDDEHTCFPIHCTDCPEIDCQTPTSSPAEETHLSSKSPTRFPAANPTVAPSTASDFRYVCAAGFVEAWTHCTNLPPCSPAGTECENDTACLPIHCTDCPEIRCSSKAPTPSPSASRVPTMFLISQSELNETTPSTSPAPSTANSSQVVAVYDSSLRAPRCSEVGSSCLSGELLAGVGPSEPNAPNTVDGCTGEGGVDFTSNFTTSAAVRHDESVNRITVRTTDGWMIGFDSEVEVEITLSAANDTSNRSVPNKWSVAHVYYAPRVLVKEKEEDEDEEDEEDGEEISWKFLKSFVVEPGSGENVLSIRFDLGGSKGSNEAARGGEGSFGSSFSSAVRVSYGYAQYRKRSCASEGVEDLSYLDVDDLVFVVASSSPTPSEIDAAPTAVPSYFPTTNNAMGRWCGVALRAILSFLAVVVALV